VNQQFKRPKPPSCRILNESSFGGLCHNCGSSRKFSLRAIFGLKTAIKNHWQTILINIKQMELQKQ